MSRFFWNKKAEAEDLIKLNIYWLRKNGCLSKGWHNGVVTWSSYWNSDSSVQLLSDANYPPTFFKINYLQTNLDGSKQNFSYSIFLTTTMCHFGGQRFWFTCPLTNNNVACGRRVAVLYKGNDFFGCRHCFEVSYRSRNENRRGLFYPIGKVLDFLTQEGDLRRDIKRWSYGGKRTKKVNQLDKNYRKVIPYIRTFAQEK